MRGFILTGKVGEGKSTSLYNLVSKYPGKFEGILCLVKADLRWFFDIEAKEFFPLETKDTEIENAVKVGKFTFLGESFSRANNILKVKNSNFTKLVIVDELGKLEMKEEGLFSSINELLKSKTIYENEKKLILVIRDYLMQEAIEKFQLQDFAIVNKDDLEKEFLKIR